MSIKTIPVAEPQIDTKIEEAIGEVETDIQLVDAQLVNKASLSDLTSALSSAGIPVIKPYYVEGMATFCAYSGGVPGGIGNYTGGNAYWGISGTSGDSYVTVTSGTFADASGVWGSVIVDDDGVCHMHLVTGNDGVNKLNITPALTVTITTGEIGCLHDMAQGQHFTSRGYKALAQHIYNASPKYAERNKYVAKFKGADTSGWTNIGAPYVKYNAATNIRYKPLQGHSSKTVSVYCYATETNQGVKMSANVAGRNGFLEFRLGIKTVGLSTITVEYWLDGVLTTSYENQSFGFYRFDFASTNTTAEVRAYIPSCAVISEFNISDTTWWVNEITNGAKMFPANSSIVYCGDSWGTYHSEALVTELRRLLLADYGYPARVINHSTAGYSSKWMLSWFHDYVIKERPTHVVIEYFVNDNNSVNGTNLPTFTDPYNVAIDMDIASNTVWRSNIRAMVDMAIRNGIQPIVLCPCCKEQGTGGDGAGGLPDFNVYLAEGSSIS